MARTDSDSWDLASSVGATATMVATARALASKEPEPLIFDPYAAPLVRAVGIDYFTRLVDGDVEIPADQTGSGIRMMIDVMAVRTRFFDDFFTDAAAAGVRQAVILASGLDSRPYRLPWPAGTVVYEIDQPRGARCQDRGDVQARRRTGRETSQCADRPARGLAEGIARQWFRFGRSRQRGAPKAC